MSHCFRHDSIPPQGYRPGDIAVLTPYVGQLQRLCFAVAKNKMHVLLNEKDAEDLAELEDQRLEDSGAGASKAGAAPAGGDAVSSAWLHSAANASLVTLKESLRVTTIDNFQVRSAGAHTLVYRTGTGCNAGACRALVGAARNG